VLEAFGIVTGIATLLSLAITVLEFRRNARAEAAVGPHHPHSRRATFDESLRAMGSLFTTMILGVIAVHGDSGGSRLRLARREPPCDGF
jgi:hypothetical protein